MLAHLTAFKVNVICLFSQGRELGLRGAKCLLKVAELGFELRSVCHTTMETQADHCFSLIRDAFNLATCSLPPP